MKGVCGDGVSPAFLEELRARLTLSSVVGRRTRLVKAGREYKACCPFHNEKTPSFYVNDDKQFFHCFGCGAHGDVIGFTMRADHLSFPEAIEKLAGEAGLDVPRMGPAEREKAERAKTLGDAVEAACVWYQEKLRAPKAARRWPICTGAACPTTRSSVSVWASRPKAGAISPPR